MKVKNISGIIPKILTGFTASALLCISCTKSDDLAINPTPEVSRVVDTVYNDLAEMASDNQYADMEALLEGEVWKTYLEHKYLVRVPSDTLYFGILQSGTNWEFRFIPYPFNEKQILKTTAQGEFEIDDFIPFPDRFEIDGQPDYAISKSIRYEDSTMSFDLKRSTAQDSLITIEYIRLQTDL